MLRNYAAIRLFRTTLKTDLPFIHCYWLGMGKLYCDKEDDNRGVLSSKTVTVVYPG